MINVSIKQEKIAGSYFIDPAMIKRLGLWLLLFFMLLLPLILHADGLFDFQMKLAQRDNAEAQFKVGQMYATGFGVKKNEQEALKWINKAADQGHETAKFELLYRNMKKNGMSSKNKKEFDNLQAKATAENPQAMYYLGNIYAHGAGLKVNNARALEWLNKAALVGVTGAEPEMALVREKQQRKQLAKRRAENKKRAQQKALQAAEKQKKLVAQRKLQLQQQLTKKHAEELQKKQTAAAMAVVSQKQKQQAEKLLSQQKSQAFRLKEEALRLKAESLQLKAQKQALLKKRAADKRKRKAEFESDPCSGKSARFLSTCR